MLKIHPTSGTTSSFSPFSSLIGTRDVRLRYSHNLNEKAKFEVVGGLCVGGYSTVVRVKNIYKNQKFAMKVISKQYLNLKNDSSRIRKYKSLIIDELKILKNETIQQSLFLQKCYYSFESNYNVFFVLELYEGKDLFYHLHQHKKLHGGQGFQEDKVKLILAELYLAISHLHACGYIHRDLKIENIMVNHDGHIKLIDFGLAVEFKHQIQPMSAMGSLVYMAPELIRDKTGGRHTDWWSYGVLAHELLTGRSPWSNSIDYKVIKNEILSGQKRKKKLFSNQKNKAFSKPITNFISLLLCENVKKRLGYENDIEIEQHELLSCIYWEYLKCLKCCDEIQPPFQPLNCISSKRTSQEIQKKTNNFMQNQEVNEAKFDHNEMKSSNDLQSSQFYDDRIELKDQVSMQLDVLTCVDDVDCYEDNYDVLFQHQGIDTIKVEKLNDDDDLKIANQQKKSLDCYLKLIEKDHEVVIDDSKSLIERLVGRRSQKTKKDIIIIDLNTKKLTKVKFWFLGLENAKKYLC